MNSLCSLGPGGELLRHAQEANHPEVPAACAEVVDAMCGLQTAGGVVLPSASWAVSAVA